MRLIYTFIFILALTLPCGATDYYVATTGSDSTGDGSSGNPWRTPQKAMDNGSPVSAGDTVYVRAGTYTDSDSSGRTILISGAGPQGTSGNLITLRSENYYEATIQAPTNGGSMVAILVNRPYIKIEGFEITGDGLSGTQPAGTGISGVFLESSATGAVVANNKIHDIGRNICSASVNAMTGIFTRGASGQTFTGNEIYKVGRRYNGESGCTLTPGGGGLTQNDHAFYVEKANNTTITRNVSYDNARGFCLNVFSSGEASTFQHTNLTFDHNTCDTPAGETRGPAGQVIYGQSHDGFLIRNNIFSRPETCVLQTFSVGTFTNVSVIGNRTDIADSNFHCAASPPTGVTVGVTNVASASLGFSNLAGNVYTLAVGSSSIDAGQDLGDSFIGAAPDPGAFEFTSPGKTRYVSLSGSDSRTCSESESLATPKRSFVSAVGCMSPGDTLYVRGGTWTEQMDFQGPNKSGSAGAPLIIAGFPGERPVLRYAGTQAHGAIKARGQRGWFTFRNFVIDGEDQAVDAGWSIRDGNHDFILEDLEIKNQFFNGLYIDGATNVIVRNSSLHDARTNCGPGVTGNRFYGVYAHHGTNLLLENLEIYNMPGGGMQLYTGPWNGLVVRNNNVHENASCPNTHIGGILIQAHEGNITGLEVYNNRSWNNAGDGQGWGSGFTFQATSPFTINGKVYNNVSVGNQFGSTGFAWGYNIQGAGVTLDLKNNIAFGNESGSVTTGGGPTLTRTHNACPTAHSSQCGATGFVAMTAATTCLISTTDHRLKNGTNPCRNTGTAVTTRTPIGSGTDIGAYEQPEISTITIDSNVMEVTFSTGGLQLSPTSALTGLTPACSGHASCGTPVGASGNLKGGSDVTVQIVISGIGGDGNCALTQTWTLSGASMNFGAGYVGVSGSDVQSINDFSNASVTEICTGSGGSPPTGMIAHYKYNVSDGTDSSGNGNTGTVSAGVTFVSGFDGLAASIPTDATFNHIEVTGFGTGLDPTTDSLSKCVLVVPDTQYAQKVVFSSGGNGTSQRWYAGWATVNGQQQWGIGIQGSGMTTGSEFVVSAQQTLVCLRSNATNDTAYLSVNGVTGTIAGKSVKTYTSYLLVDDLRTGNDGSFTVNNGGFIIDEDRTWNTFISDQDVADLYESLFPAGGTPACYAQVAHSWQPVYPLDVNNPTTIGTDSQAIEVVANGAVAIVFQINCTGSAGSSITLKFHYSLDGTTFALRIPGTLGADGIAMWGSSLESTLNRFTAECCITGALSTNDGITVLDAVSNPTITLSQNHSYTVRIIVKVGAIAGESRWIRAMLDNGSELAGGYTPVGGARINVIAARASGQ